MKKTALFVRIVRLLCIVCFITLLLISCTDTSRHDMLKEVQKVIIACINNDQDQFNSCMDSACSAEELPQQFWDFCELLDGVGYFRLAIVNYSSETVDDITIKSATLGLYSEVGHFVVKSTMDADTNEILSLSIVLDTENVLPDPED